MFTKYLLTRSDGSVYIARSECSSPHWNVAFLEIHPLMLSFSFLIIVYILVHIWDIFEGKWKHDKTGFPDGPSAINKNHFVFFVVQFSLARIKTNKGALFQRTFANFPPFLTCVVNKLISDIIIYVPLLLLKTRLKIKHCFYSYSKTTHIQFN